MPNRVHVGTTTTCPKWSKKWQMYVDVTTVGEVEDGDKPLVIPKPGNLTLVN